MLPLHLHIDINGWQLGVNWFVNIKCHDMLSEYSVKL